MGGFLSIDLVVTQRDPSGAGKVNEPGSNTWWHHLTGALVVGHVPLRYANALGKFCLGHRKSLSDEFYLVHVSILAPLFININSGGDLNYTLALVMF